MSNDGSFADKVPRGLRGLNKKHTLFGSDKNVKSNTTISITKEQEQLQQEAMAMEQWWAQARWKQTKRTYTGTLTIFAKLPLTMSLFTTDQSQHTNNSN
jgi:hypothetical protein